MSINNSCVVAYQFAIDNILYVSDVMVLTVTVTGSDRSVLIDLGMSPIQIGSFYLMY